MKKIIKIVLRILTTILILVLVALALLQLRQPSNDRDWNLDQDTLSYAEFNGDEVLVKNVRNFSYESTTEYTPDYYDKNFDLNKLESLYYIVEPFGNIGSAHTFVSFGFEGGDFLAISVEIRKEKGESFSAIKGLFRQYELMYVIADERDVIDLRVNHRKDDVYVYPIETTTEKMKELFVDMLERANSLKENPEFYNTLTNTCTTNIARHANKITPNSIPWDLRLLLPKNSDALVYELGLIENSRSLEEVRERYRINEKAEKYADDPNFSLRIRE